MQDSSEIGKSLPFHGQDSNSYVIQSFQCELQLFFKEGTIRRYSAMGFLELF